jgi:hypothetical protein
MCFIVTRVHPFATGSNSVKGRHCHSHLGSDRMVVKPDLTKNCATYCVAAISLGSSNVAKTSPVD